MSREQVNSYRKHRDAEDPTGNLTWIVRLQQKALRQSPEQVARMNVEADFELSDEEKILWRLMKLARKVMDIEHSSILPTDKLRGFLRGLVAADMLDIIDATEAKALLPAEVRRVKAEVAGGPAPAKASEPLRAKVYRPDISKPTPEELAAAAAAAEAPSAAPAAVEGLPPPPRSDPGSRDPGSRDPSSRDPGSRNPGGRAGPGAAPAPFVMPPTGSMSTDDRTLRDSIVGAHAAMSKQTHYEFLGLQRPSDDVSVRQAFVRLAREYHPDRLAGSGIAGDPSLQKKIDQLFKRLNDAQAALATAEARAGYDRHVTALSGTPASGVDGAKVRRPAEAGNAFRMGDTFFKKKDFKQAEAHFRQAVMFDPEDPKILTALAWCLFMNPDHDEKERTAEAKKRLAEVAQKFKFADAYYKSGLILRKGGDEAGAARAISNAHKLDPNHVDAAREARLVDMREKKAQDEKDEKNSLFGKLMRK